MIWRKLFGIGDLDRASFASLFVKLGRREGILVEPRIDPVGFAVHDGSAVYNLHNVYARFLALPRRDRQPFVMHALQAQREAQDGLPDSWETAAPRLRPRVRDATFLDHLAVEQRRRGHALAPCAEPIAPGLFVTLVVDAEHSMATVTPAELEEWGVSFEQALDRARKNLLDRSLDDFVPLCDGLWIGPWSDSYAASRLLLTHLLQRLTPDPLVAVPNRDAILVASARSEVAMAALVHAIEAATEDGAYLLSRRIHRLHGHRYQPFELPDEHPAALDHRNMCALETIDAYGEQQRALAPEHEGVYVARAEADEGPDGRWVSRAVWTHDVASLLPDVERLLLVDADGSYWVAELGEVLALEGALERSAEHLTRWRTRRFPSYEELCHCAAPIAQDELVAQLGDARASDRGLDDADVSAHEDRPSPPPPRRPYPSEP